MKKYSSSIIRSVRFVLLCFCAFVLLLQTTEPSFAIDLGPIQGLPGGYQGADIQQAPTTLELIVTNTVGFITVIAGASFLIYTVLAGLTWITARDESARMDRAKQMFTNALVGLAIVVISWAFTGVMETIFGFNILNVAELLGGLKP